MGLLLLEYRPAADDRLQHLDILDSDGVDFQRILGQDHEIGEFSLLYRSLDILLD